MSVKIDIIHRCDTCGKIDKEKSENEFYENPRTLFETMNTNLPYGWRIKGFEVQCDTCYLKEPQVQ